MLEHLLVIHTHKQLTAILKLAKHRTTGETGLGIEDVLGTNRLSDSCRLSIMLAFY